MKCETSLAGERVSYDTDNRDNLEQSAAGIAEDDRDSGSESEDSIILVNCNGCGARITDPEWHKCTECSTTEDHFDICMLCYDKQFHNEHFSSISIYADPPSDCETFCDACGKSCENDTDIYRCDGCVGSFTLIMI